MQGGGGGGAGRTGCMNHGARDGSRVRIPKRCRFFFFFFSFSFFLRTQAAIYDHP